MYNINSCDWIWTESKISGIVKLHYDRSGLASIVQESLNSTAINLQAVIRTACLLYLQQKCIVYCFCKILLYTADKSLPTRHDNLWFNILGNTKVCCLLSESLILLMPHTVRVWFFFWLGSLEDIEVLSLTQSGTQHRWLTGRDPSCLCGDSKPAPFLLWPS